jgi:membrane protein
MFSRKDATAAADKPALSTSAYPATDTAPDTAADRTSRANRAASPAGASGDDHETRPIRTAELEPDPKRPGELKAVDDDGVTGEGIAEPAVAYNDKVERPAPEHPDKVEKPTELKKPSVVAALRRTVSEFGADQCTDVAAGLTYYSVLAIFPATLALLSLLGVVGQAQSSVNAVMDVLRPLTDAGTRDSIRPILQTLSTAQGAGVTLVIGILGALWSASGYVGAFSRAMNRILEVEEGRPFWKMRPMQLVVTVFSVALCAVALLILVVTGPVAQSVGDRIGAGDTVVLVWGIAKWPVLLLIVVGIVGMLYYATPNVRQPHFRWISVGAFVAIVIWLVASVGFAFYVANFSSYNKTYGAVAGAVVALLWIWLTNVALLFGAELDSELERSRELQSGIAAEETLQLPLRDDRQILKAERKQAKTVASARRIRERHPG